MYRSDVWQTGTAQALYPLLRLPAALWTPPALQMRQSSAEDNHPASFSPKSHADWHHREPQSFFLLFSVHKSDTLYHNAYL